MTTTTHRAFGIAAPSPVIRERPTVDAIAARGGCTDLAGSVVLDVYDDTAIPDYRTDYRVTAARVGRHHHGPLYRFTGSRDDLVAMVAENWSLVLIFEDDGTDRLADVDGLVLDDAPDLRHRLTHTGRNALA